MPHSCCVYVSGPSDLGQVLRVLHDAGLAAKWRAIGQTLTVSDADLSDFEARFSGDSSLCLLQVVASWLRGQKRHPDPPSWCRLVWAVADPHGGATVYGGKRIAATFKGVCTWILCALVLEVLGSLTISHIFLLLQLCVAWSSLLPQAYMPRRPHLLYCVSNNSRLYSSQADTVSMFLVCLTESLDLLSSVGYKL